MKKPSDLPPERETLRNKLIGLGEQSTRKSYYPELQQRLAELERFKALLDNSNDAIFQLEVPTGRIIDVNESACRQLRRHRDELLQLSIFAISDLGRLPVAQLINEPSAIQKGRELVTSTLYVRDGRQLAVEMTLSRMSFDGSPYVVAVARDISARLHTEQALSERIRLATLGAEIGSALTEGSNLHNTLQCCAVSLVKHTYAAFARIWVFTPREQVLQLHASAGLYTNINGKFSRILPGQGKVGLIAKEQRAILIQDVTNDPQIRDPEWIRREGIVAFAGYPLVVAERLVGVMAMFFKQPMNEIILGSLASIANEVAIGIERQQTEESLRHSLVEIEAARARVDAILRSVADGLLVTDALNRLTLMNPRAEEVLGVRFKDALQAPIESILADKHLLDQISATLTGAAEITPATLEIPAKGNLPAVILQAQSAVVSGADGTIAGVVTILRDITRDRDIDRMKNEFISRAAHELRTPLASVMGYADLLLNQEEYDITDPRQQREFLSLIWDKGQNLSNIIDDLLDLSRIQAGRSTELNREPCNLSKLTSRVLQPYRKFSPNHRFELDSSRADQDLYLDCPKIEQVLDNLLGNAVKYSPNGGRIRVTAEVAGQQARVTIEDQGIGMTVDQQQKIFEKFYRIDRSDTAIGGLGLGLAIVKEIIEAHGGSVGVDSAPGGGSRFYFTLPCPPEDYGTKDPEA